jgi:mutator protein MutT
MAPIEPKPEANLDGEAVLVIAGVVRRGDRLLLGRRPVQKRHGGLWEFPGGKLRAGESLLEGARREFGEELGLTVTALGPERFIARDPGARFEIHFVEVQVEGEPLPTEHTEIGWFTRTELARLSLAPADARFVREGFL